MNLCHLHALVIRGAFDGKHTQLTYHIIFGTKYRKTLISHNCRDGLYQYIGGILRSQSGSLLEIGGIADHVHVLAQIPPTLALANVVRDIKANSSRWVNETYSSSYPFAWQTGYGASSVSHSQIPKVTEYIQRQEEHHRKFTFAQEYVNFRQRHGIHVRHEYLFEEEDRE